MASNSTCPAPISFLESSTNTPICGLQFNAGRTCGFKLDASVTRLCCVDSGGRNWCEFTFGERLGLFMSVQSSIFSAVAVTILLLYVLYRNLKKLRFLWSTYGFNPPSDASDSSLFLNLMFADLVQAGGNIPTVRWMKDGHITEDRVCTAQAVLKQVGIVGVALTSLAIAVHTFCVLVLRWRARRTYSKRIIFSIWFLDALVVGIPNIVHRKEKYYGNTKWWCWIVTKYRTEQIVSEYLWVWAAAFLMIILYGIMFIVMRGFLVIDKGIFWHKTRERVRLSFTATEDEEDGKTKAVANLMLFYPAVYVFCVLPNSVSRWMYFNGHTFPYQATLFASSVFSLSGLFNVLLFFLTRPELVVGQQTENHTAQAAMAEVTSLRSPRATTPTSPISAQSSRAPLRKTSTGPVQLFRHGRLPDMENDTVPRMHPDLLQRDGMGAQDFDPRSLVLEESGHPVRWGPSPGGLVVASGSSGAGGGDSRGGYGSMRSDYTRVPSDGSGAVGSFAVRQEYPRDVRRMWSSSSIVEEEEQGRLPESSGLR